MPFLARLATDRPAGTGAGAGVSMRLKWASCLAAGWAVWATLSAVVSPRPVLALVGNFTSYTGALFVLALAGVWALGVGLDQRSRTWLEQADIVADLGGHGPEVLELRRRAVGREPGMARWWNNLGDEAYGGDETSTAERAWRGALARNPWSVRSLNGLGRVLLDTSRTAEARDLLSRSLLVDPGQDGVRDAVEGL